MEIYVVFVEYIDLILFFPFHWIYYTKKTRIQLNKELSQ